MTFFMTFSKNFPKLRFWKFSKRWRSQSFCWIFWGYSQGCEASDCGCSNSCSFRDMTFFFGIFSIFLRKFGYKKFHKTWNYHLCSEALSGYSQVLRILPPSMTAQILVVFEISLFFMIFSEIFKKNLNVKNSKTLKISILLLESARVLSGCCESCLWILLRKFL